MFVIHKKHIIFVSLLLAVLLCGCVLLTALSTSAVSTNGMTIVLDAGHGGEDGGAVSRAFRAGAPQFSHAPDGRVPYSSAYTNPSRSRMVFRFCLPR